MKKERERGRERERETRRELTERDTTMDVATAQERP